MTERDLKFPTDETMDWLASLPSGKLVNVLRDAGRISHRPEDISMLAQLIERIRLARPEAALIKDAERYRFLKARRGNIVEIAWNSFYSDIYSTAKMGNVDAAIDAAMRLQCGPQESGR